MTEKLNYRQRMFVRMGRMFGYPDCCIANFLKRADMITDERKAIPKSKLTGTGYVPCPECNETKTEEELVETIELNRLFMMPFPVDKM